jgi:hypothetical protein
MAVVRAVENWHLRAVVAIVMVAILVVAFAESRVEIDVNTGYRKRPAECALWGMIAW